MFANTNADVTPMKPKKGALVGHVSVDMVFPLTSSPYVDLRGTRVGSAVQFRRARRAHVCAVVTEASLRVQPARRGRAPALAGSTMLVDRLAPYMVAAAPARRVVVRK